MRRARWVWWCVWWVALGVLAGPAAPAAAQASWTWPLGDASALGRPFDPPAHRYGSGHRGVDLAAPPGTPVAAAAAGRVSYAGLLAGRGVVVVVHGELRTTYEPVDAAVGVGQVVAAGEVLGTLAGGHAGCAAEACLHWGLRRGEEYLDPLLLVGGGPVRLLPLGPVPGAVPTAAPEQAAGPEGQAVGGGEAGAGPRPDRAPAPDEPVRAEPAASLQAQLRSAASPSGALALIALVAGIALLRPGHPPRRPGGGAVGTPGGAPPSAAVADRADLTASAPEEVPAAEVPGPAGDDPPRMSAAGGSGAADRPCPSCAGTPPDPARPDVVDLRAERDRRRAEG